MEYIISFSQTIIADIYVSPFISGLKCDFVLNIKIGEFGMGNTVYR